MSRFPSMPEEIDSWGQFWVHYLRQHARPETRAMHYAATLGGLLIFGIGLACRQWLLLPIAPLIGYACAWIGHFAIEGNRPATFQHPFWSLLCDFRMLFLFLTGTLGPELERASIR